MILHVQPFMFQVKGVPFRLVLLTLTLGLTLGLGIPQSASGAEKKAVTEIPAAGRDSTVKHVRKVFNEIQTAVDQKRYKKVTVKYHDEPLVFELTGWFDGKTVRKITSILPGEDGGGYEDYYFDSKGCLIFVYNTYSEMSENNREAKIENRFYFDGKDLSFWKMEGRANHTITSADRKAEKERLTGNARNFKVELTKKHE